MNSKRLVLLSSVLVAGLFLAGCNNEEKEQIRTARVDYQILDTFAYDKVKVVVEEEKTASELAELTLKGKVGLSTDDDLYYPEIGIAKDQGIFVETAIADGPIIPTRSGFSDKSIDLINNTDRAEWEKALNDSFSNLQAGREQSLASLNENIDKQAELTVEIEKAAAEQKKRIAEQEKAKEAQDKLDKELGN